MLHSLHTLVGRVRPTFELPSPRAVMVVIGSFSLLPGCGSEEPIRHYRVPNRAELFASNHVEKETRDVPRRAAPAKPNAAIRYKKPGQWHEETHDEFSQLAFGVSAGDRSARITVSLFQGDGGDIVANVNRWRDQVGLGETTAAALDKETEALAIQGVMGRYVEVESPDTASAPKAIHGWIGDRQGQRWFFKIRGDASLVRAQRENFRDFLKSVKFTASDGAGDGI